MDHVRIGIIGCGGMGAVHMSYMDKLDGAKLTAIADMSEERVASLAAKYNVKGFPGDGTALLDSGVVDAVLIATPHYFHPPITKAAFERNLHVLCEKPIAVTAKAAEDVIAVRAKHPQLFFSLMFQSRTNPTWKKVKEIVDTGQLGKLTRLVWVVTDWYRTQAYYDSGGWRATWAGEGGGALINQCPHNLDLLQWFMGMPQTVQSHVSLGKHHHIEVEDDVTAFLEWAPPPLPARYAERPGEGRGEGTSSVERAPASSPISASGATGVFITSTGESPGTSRLEISGEGGKITTAGTGTIEFIKNEVPTPQHTQSSNEAFAKAPSSKITIDVSTSGTAGTHQHVTQNFINAILRGEPLIARGEEGINGLELGNAMLMSGLTHQPVKLPMDRAAFDAHLQKLARESTFKKGAVKAAKSDLNASFKA